MSKFRLILITILYLIINCGAGYCDYAEEVSNRIRGIADFLIERANENAIDMFNERINNNIFIRQYFPNTTKILRTFDLKVVMLNNALWQQYVEKDLNSFGYILKKRLQDEGISLLSDKSFGELKKKYQLVNNPRISIKIEKVVNQVDSNLRMIKYDALSDTDSLKLAAMYVDDSVKMLDEILTTEDTMHEINISTDILRTIGEFRRDLNNISESYEDIRCILDNSLTYTTRTTHAFLVIENIEGFNKIVDPKSIDYKRYKNYALFFAQLTDAKTINDAKVTLQTFALPSSSYKSKRRNETKLSISAYLGISGGQETGSTNSYSYSGLFTPIGIEYSWGRKGESSVGILGNVIDLGAVVNSQINESSETFGFKDILAPGVAIIYGIPKVPLAIGIGGFKVHGLQKDSSSEMRYLGFVAFDMPLFALY